MVYTVLVRVPTAWRFALTSPSRTSRLGSWYKTLSTVGKQ
jgi:hypothetical protein